MDKMGETRGVAVTKGSLILRTWEGRRGAEKKEKGRIPDKAYSACVQLEPKAAMAEEARERRATAALLSRWHLGTFRDGAGRILQANHLN